MASKHSIEGPLQTTFLADEPKKNRGKQLP